MDNIEKITRLLDLFKEDGYNISTEEIAIAIIHELQPQDKNQSYSKSIAKGSICDGEFSGVLLDSEDDKRLRTQLRRVLDWWESRKGEWHTDFECYKQLGIEGASAQAQRRNLKKLEFGGYKFEDKKIGSKYYYKFLS